MDSRKSWESIAFFLRFLTDFLDVCDQVIELCIEIIPRAERGTILAMTGDGLAIGFQAIITAKCRQKLHSRMQLQGRWLIIHEIANDVDANRMVILIVAMSADHFHRTAALNRAILANEEMIANACPAIRKMPAMHFFGGNVAIGIANVMDNNAIGYWAMFQRAKRKMRFANGNA